MKNQKTRLAQIRTTIVLPSTVDQNLELFALRSGLSKGVIVRKAVEEFLLGQGLRPNEEPRIHVSYQGRRENSFR